MNILIESIDLKIHNQINLSSFTSLKIGGPAEWLSEPRNINELHKLISWAKNKKIPSRVIGAGSNLLISDRGLDGLTICTRKMHGGDINHKTGKVMALSGESLPSLARRAANAGLHGLEWAIGIPGTVGGAVVMNAGAQGSCIAEKIISAEVMPLIGGTLQKLAKKDLLFSYRNSRLQKEELIVLSALFQLEPGHNPKEINKKTDEILNHRKNTQPYHLPSCGSVFRNPEPHKAGFLIEQLGLKGTKSGGAEISKLHANFIVNTLNASAEDIQKLISMIQIKVKEKHGFLLHPEVKQLGFKRNE
ncbi:UDP-N-acetylmuramate dehydrogenase [Prochlorococcus sp. MIT 1223]|uniref:UDP-N-acetylmuramate dehydrogenase n=1 Tax=Prochlorococcus sp. MIT 1223 TaxID=3096217 RepID=UPI002A755960|nr:UDP-N-acetylmuramate dehydrogenase [Prochlorococcus sp. MIT 1223]